MGPVSIKLSAIFNEFRDRGLVREFRGDDVEIKGFGSVDHYTAGDLVFVNKSQPLTTIAATPPAAVVTEEKFANALNGNGIPVLVSDNVALAQALIRQAFDDRDPHASEWPRVHPSAVIHETTQVPETVTIGPGVVIGQNVILGERAVIQAGTIIEQDVVIGADSIVQPQVYIGWGCRIGARVRIKPGTVIGGEGFGLAPDENKRYHRIPHRGIVVIEDDVIIGANCNIDRATYTETRIGRGCRLDALCHIAHNVILEEDCLLMAGTSVAGSSRFGKRVIASGQTGVLDHKTIVDDVILVHRCGVVEDIKQPGMYAATPPQPFVEYSKNVVVLRKLHLLRKKVLELEKRLAALNGDDNSSDD